MNRNWSGWKWIAFGVLGVAVVGLALRIGSTALTPWVRTQFLTLLRDRYGEAQVGQMQVTVFPKLHATAENIAIPDAGVSIGKASVDASAFGLLAGNIHIQRVALEGLKIEVGGGVKHPASGGTGGKNWIVDELIADGTVLRVNSEKPGKTPLEWDIRKLRMHSVGLNSPMEYRAELMNAKPPGVIHATGNFGPWVKADPGQTPLDGKYTFADADLSVFNGISGKLSSEGKFAGVLGRIVADGTTDTPDFMLRVSGNPVHLKTQFHAVIDGTNGETLLQPVRAQFLNTTVDCRGGVIETPAVNGKTVDLDATVQNGRLEDILRLATKSKNPMSGAISFRSKIVIPPGHLDVDQKLRLDGQFSVHAARFHRGDIQEKVNELSSRAKGNPEEGGTHNVVSNLSGRFRMANGRIHLDPVAFEVPGAHIRLAGSYTAEGGELDFRGEARLQARVSEMTTGVKSLLLKAIDPFFAKKGAGAVIPIRIAGTEQHPSVGLAFGK